MRLVLALVVFLLALPVRAEGPAALIADRVQIRADRVLVAEGNVEVLYQGRRLRAARLEYDRAQDRLTIAGPITLTDPGGSVVLADSAELAADLTEGILRSARIVLDRQLQMAAVEIARVGGRYTQMSRAVASSCRVCDSDETPLWEIRARRVVHDQQGRQIYFDRAQFRLGGVPVLWFPRLRMPDPTLARSSGFLMPRLVSTSALGTGLHVPYFVTLGRHRDLTITPFAASKDVFALGLRYRQAFRTGAIEVSGIAARDRLVSGRRGYATATGGFALGRGFRLDFAAEGVSDRAFLRDYGLSEKDRLDSRATITRTRRDEHISARAVYVHSIREGEVNSELPAPIGDVGWTRRLDMPVIGGVATLSAVAHGHYRSSEADGAGRDMLRSSFAIDWRRDWIGPSGIVLAAQAGGAADLHRIYQDTRWPRRVSTLTPHAAVEARWPLARTSVSGASEVLEPVVQLVWSRSLPPDHVPNEDSTQVEFDEGNLFALSRFAGADRREGGLRLNAGVGWTRIAPSGWVLGVSAGRVIRARDDAQFTAPSGLSGRRSDWLTAVHLSGPDGTRLVGRAAFDDRLKMSRAELRLAMERARYGLDLAWLWDLADPAENRMSDTSELMIDSRYRLTDLWTARAGTRYDFTAGRATRAAVGLQFANECLRVDVSLSRRFTSSTSVRPTTDFGVSVDLAGFGSNRAAGPAGRSCRR